MDSTGSSGSSELLKEIKNLEQGASPGKSSQTSKLAQALNTLKGAEVKLKSNEKLLRESGVREARTAYTAGYEAGVESSMHKATESKKDRSDAGAL